VDKLFLHVENETIQQLLLHRLVNTMESPLCWLYLCFSYAVVAAPVYHVSYSSLTIHGSGITFINNVIKVGSEHLGSTL